MLRVFIHNVLTQHTTSWRSPPSGMVVEHAFVVAGHCELRGSQWCLTHLDNYSLISYACAQLVSHQTLQVQPGWLQPTAVACPDTQYHIGSSSGSAGAQGIYRKQGAASILAGTCCMQVALHIQGADTRADFAAVVY